MIFGAGLEDGGVQVDYRGGDFGALRGETGDVDGCKGVVVWD